MKKYTVIFDLVGTLVRMRPPFLLVNRRKLEELSALATLAIITGARKTETINVLRKLKIDKYFSPIITKDDSPYIKPDKKVFLVLQRKIKSKYYVCIGDSVKDFIFSRNCNLPFLFVGRRKLGVYQNRNVNQVIDFLTNNFLAIMKGAD